MLPGLTAHHWHLKHPAVAAEGPPSGLQHCSGNLVPCATVTSGAHLNRAIYVMQVFDGGSRAVLRQLKGHQAACHATRFAPDGQHILSAADDTTVRKAAAHSSMSHSGLYHLHSCFQTAGTCWSSVSIASAVCRHGACNKVALSC